MVVYVWDCIVENDLKKLIGIIYTSKMHLLFGSPSLNNLIVKRAWLGVIMGWVTSWKFFGKHGSKDKTR